MILFSRSIDCISFSDGASICMDLGHLTLKRGDKSIHNRQELALSKEAKVKLYIVFLLTKTFYPL